MAEASALKDLQYAFAAHLRDPERAPAPEGIDPRRLQVYRDLFFNSLRSLLSGNFPVLRKLREAADWDRLVRDFYREHASTTPLFPEVGREFARYLAARAEAGRDDPPWQAELADYEWSEIALNIDEHEIDAVAHNPDGDLVNGVPVLSSLLRLLCYRFPVHQLRLDYRPEQPPEEPTYLVLVRNRKDRVSFMALNAVSARLLALMQESPKSSGLELLQRIAAELGAADPAPVIQFGSELLGQLKQRDVLLGTLPD